MRITREDGVFKIKKGKCILNENGIQIYVDEIREKLLHIWASEQIDIINEKKFHSIVGAFFVYKIVPTTIGAQIMVSCPCTGNDLNLSLVGDEEW